MVRHSLTSPFGPYLTSVGQMACGSARYLGRGLPDTCGRVHMTGIAILSAADRRVWAWPNHHVTGAATGVLRTPHPRIRRARSAQLGPRLAPHQSRRAATAVGCCDELVVRSSSSRALGAAGLFGYQTPPGRDLQTRSEDHRGRDDLAVAGRRHRSRRPATSSRRSRRRSARSSPAASRRSSSRKATRSRKATSSRSSRTPIRRARSSPPRSRVGVAQARIATARANLAEITQQVERERALVASGAVGKANLDNLVAREAALKETVRAAEAETTRRAGRRRHVRRRPQGPHHRRARSAGAS